MSKYKCPNCGDTDGILGQVTLWAAFVQDGDSISLRTDVDDNPEHGPFDMMKCLTCLHYGFAFRFLPDSAWLEKCEDTGKKLPLSYVATTIVDEQEGGGKDRKD